MATISTGRGGSGNMVNPSKSPQLSPQLNPQISTHSNIEGTYNGGHDLLTSLSRNQHNNDGEVYYSTGRGGAGNLNKGSNIPSPKLAPHVSQQNSLTPVFSTGRGGYGNMTKIDDIQPDQQAVINEDENLAPKISNKSFTVGRGGYGNFVQKGDEAENDEGLCKKWFCF